ncbi:flagellin [Oscillospiraceae bacterium 44-34]
MRIQHNIMAMNAYRNYNNNASALSKNLEKLSSGYKINRAGDDAAGLAISEKMRAQITGLNAASKNVKDGISLVKTAEGAMQEIQDMLNRMDYLATQSANGTYQDEVDREALQKEVNQLKDEINRIADSANFNGIKLLDGSLAGTSSSAATSVGKITGNIDVMDVDATKATYEMNAALATGNGTAAGDTYKVTVSLTDADGKATKEISVEFKHDGTNWLDADGNEVELGTATSAADAVMSALKKDATIKDNFTVANSNGVLTFTAKQGGSDTMKVSAINVAQVAGGTETVTNNGIKSTAGVDAHQALDLTSLKIYQGKGSTSTADGTDDLEKATFTINGKKFAVVSLADMDDDMKAELKAAGVEHFLDVTDDDWGNVTADQLVDAAHKISTETGLTAKNGTWSETNNVGSFAASDTATDGHISLSAGSSKSGNGGLTLQIGDTSDSYNQLKVVVGDMHTKALGIANLSIATREDAAASIQTIKDAINNVSSVRGDLGAYQNRLEHTANNLSVMAENIQDAESTIRDTDVAEEMMSYVKNNILVQSAQAMLAQANQVPQGVLQLLG